MAIGAALGSSVIGAISSKSAQKSQEKAAAQQLALQERIYDETTDRYQPFYDQGLDYSNALRYELLGGARPTYDGTPLGVSEYTETTQGMPAFSNGWPTPEAFFSGISNQDRTRYRVGDQTFDDRAAADQYALANATGGSQYRGFEATPYQQYVLDQTRNAVDTSASASGNLFSGATMRAQQDRANSLSGGFYQDYLNRLSGQASSGQAAAGNMANAGANYAQGSSNALANMGNAGAAGAVGMGNAITGGLNNMAGIWNYQNMQAGNGNQTGGNLFGGKLFGGNSWG